MGTHFQRYSLIAQIFKKHKMPRRIKSKKKAVQQASQRSEQIAEKVSEMAKNSQLDLNENEMENVEAEEPVQAPERSTSIEQNSSQQDTGSVDNSADKPQDETAEKESAPKKKKEKKKRVSLAQMEVYHKEAADRFAAIRQEKQDRLAAMTDEERKAFKDEESAKRKKKRHEKQCGLIFPILRIRKNLKHSVGVPVRKGALRHRNAGALIKKDSAVFCAAVLEYMCAEVLEISGNAAIQAKRKRIKPRDIMLAIRDDEEINKLVSKNTVFCQSGVVPKEIPNVLRKPYQKSGAFTELSAADCYANKFNQMVVDNRSSTA